MTEPNDDPLRYLARLRAVARGARGGYWFALVVFGIVVLGAMPFYLRTMPTGSTPGCKSAGPNAVTCIGTATNTPLGGGLGSSMPFLAPGRWVTTYWAISIVLGMGMVIWFFRARANRMGVKTRILPVVLVVGASLALVLVVNRNGVSSTKVPYVGVRGLQTLLIIAIGIAALAIIERSLPLGIFATGFFGLALLSCLYDDVNILSRLGLSGPFGGNANSLPNLLLPGVFLLGGGAGFWLAEHHSRKMA
jgi:hypothetical protein